MSTEDQFKLDNGHWSISKALLGWVDQQRRSGRSDDEIVSQLHRVADNIKPQIMVPVEIDMDKVTNAIVGFVENGYSPWASNFRKQESKETIIADGQRPKESIWYSERQFWELGGIAIFDYDRPEDPEGSMLGSFVMGTAELTEGLRKMANVAPQHFADLLNENDDAVTHDVFVQCVVFGEIIYG